MDLVEKVYLNLFESAVRDCEILLEKAPSSRFRENFDLKNTVTKKLKIYFILLQNSPFHYSLDRSLEIINQILNVLYHKDYRLPQRKTLAELILK